MTIAEFEEGEKKMRAADVKFHAELKAGYDSQYANRMGVIFGMNESGEAHPECLYPDLLSYETYLERMIRQDLELLHGRPSCQ